MTVERRCHGGYNSTMLRGMALLIVSLTSAVAQNRPEIYEAREGTALEKDCGRESARRAGNGILVPSIVSKVEPKYIGQPQNATLQGSVVLQRVFDENGHACGNWIVVRSMGLRLDQQAVDAARQWVEKSSLEKRRPVPVFVMLKVEFHLPKP